MRAERLDEAVFDELAASSGEDLISIFIPTHKAGREVSQDRIHLKNQLSTADEELAALGRKPRERSERLSDANSLLDDVEFWEHQDAGLALFLYDDGGWRAVSSSKPLQASAVVMPVFMLKPLVADIHPVKAPVLALTMDAVALFEGTEAFVEMIDVELPAYDDVNWFVDRERQRQQHPDLVGTGRNRHGHEVSSKSDEDFARFLREVDSALKGFESDFPLIVLGDDDMVAKFSRHSERETLSPRNSGITAPFSESQVHEMTMEAIEELGESRVDAAISDARDKLGMGLGATSIADALPAAVTGRVDRIVIDRNADPVWGRLNESSLEVDIHEEKRPGDVDLLDRLVVWSRNNGGTVVSSETEIDDRAFIATFRY